MFVPNLDITSTTPHVDFVEKIVHIVGIPALIGGVVKFIRSHERSAKQLSEIEKRTRETEKTSAEVKAAVDTVANNHLAHLAVEVKEQTALLQSMDKNIAIIVDRFPRG